MMNKKQILRRSTFEMLPIDLLVTAEYQKNRLNVARAKKIGENYDPRKAGAIVVSKRDGKYYIVDGQHRRVGAGIAGESHMMCQVLSGLTYQQEAMFFAEQDTNARPLSRIEKFKAKLEANDNDTLRIYNTILEAGLDVSFSGGQTLGKIQAIASVERIYDKLGQNALLRTLKLINKTWNGEPSTLCANMLKGVAQLIKMFGYDLQDDIFINQLKTIDVADVVREADSAIYHSDSKSTAYAKVLLKYYNKRLRSNKLSWLMT